MSCPTLAFQSIPKKPIAKTKLRLSPTVFRHRGKDCLTSPKTSGKREAKLILVEI